MSKVIKIDNPEIYEQAANVIRDGGIIIYPTDTLYGFGVVGIMGIITIMLMPGMMRLLSSSLL